jgi:phage host-nuclease inhibitor protein Gam
MTNEQIEALVTERLKEIEARHTEQLHLMQMRVQALETAVSNMRKAFATRLTELGG